MTWRGGFVALMGALFLVASATGPLAGGFSTPLAKGVSADKVVVYKGERKLVLLRNGKPLKRYTISLGRVPHGAKARQGDGRTPEGNYRIDWRNPRSKFHLSLHITYPSKSDRATARKAGVSPGGAIMIHGIMNGFGWLGPLHRLYDWTDGCIAVTDEEIEEIWRVVPNGTPIHIRP